MKDNQRAERWLKRAAEIRAEALAMPLTDARANLLKLADDWEHMGFKAMQRAEGEGSSDASRALSSSKGWEEIPSQPKGLDTPRHH